MDSERLKLAETQLRDLREALVLEREQTGEDASPVELDQARLGRLSRMDEMQQQAMAVELNRRRDIQLQRIEGAFQRLEKGTYGDCTLCGDAIDAKRLDLDPTVFFCIDCAERAEKRR
jgi:DnaK suppressor protein